jgi:hypothetical protein
MKFKIFMVAVLIVAGFWIWRSVSPDRQDAPRHDEPIKQSESTPPETERVYTHVERPRLPARAMNSDTSKPVARVEFARRPWDPETESKEQYEVRAGLIEGFERFREETGISQERADAILMLLYDYQETIKAIRKQLYDARPYRDKWEFEYLLRKGSHAELLVSYDALDTMAEMLTPEEMRSWNRNLEHINVWWRLSYWPHMPPILVLVETSS